MIYCVLLSQKNLNKTFKGTKNTSAREGRGGLFDAIGEDEFSTVAVKKGQDVGRNTALADDDIKIAQLAMPGKEGLAEFTFIGQQEFLPSGTRQRTLHMGISDFGDRQFPCSLMP
jgi:hypothetical protein